MMKRTTMICAAMTVVLAVTSIAQAEMVTLAFRPNDLIDLYPADYDQGKAVQPDGRRMHKTFKSEYYNTFNDHFATGHSQPKDYNTYLNWRDGLTGENEGIAMFNNWFLGYSGAPTWGETWVVKPGAAASGTVTTGWNWRAVTNPYSPTDGSCIQFWTTDPTKYIRNGGADLGTFSLTVDLYEDTNGDEHWDAGDAHVNVGDEIRMWLGNLNGDDAPYYRDDTQAIYFDDQGWGSRTNAYDPFSAIDASGANNPVGSGFEAALDVTAVPVPGAVLLGVLGLGLVGVKLRKFA